MDRKSPWTGRCAILHPVHGSYHQVFMWFSGWNAEEGGSDPQENSGLAEISGARALTCAHSNQIGLYAHDDGSRKNVGHSNHLTKECG